MAVTMMGRGNTRMIADAMLAELQTVASQYGVNITYDSARFNDLEATIKFKVAPKDASLPNPVTLDAQARAFGVMDISQKFRVGVHVYEICGIKPNRPKYPFVVRRQDGAMFKMSAASVKQGIALSPVK